MQYGFVLKEKNLLCRDFHSPAQGVCLDVRALFAFYNECFGAVVERAVSNRGDRRRNTDILKHRAGRKSKPIDFLDSRRNGDASYLQAAECALADLHDGRSVDR